MQKPIIWVFTDHKVGSNKQALTIVDKLKLPYIEKKLEYNFTTWLPSIVISAFPVNVRQTVLQKLKNAPEPDIIISCGRRRSSLALYLKQHFNNKPKIINLTYFPYMSLKSLLKFDLFILSHHDRCRHNLPNSMRIIGNVNNVQDEIKMHRRDFEKYYPKLNNYIAVNVGGQTINALWCTKCRFTQKTAQEFGDILERVAQKDGLLLFITFSRRTPKHVKHYLKNRFNHPHICYDPQESGINPYPAFLEKAQFCITTSDSTSMCSEIASTGKPLYIYYRENCNKEKCELLLQQLVDEGIARKLDKNTTELEHYSYEPLDEVQKVITKLRHDFLEEYA